MELLQQSGLVSLYDYQQVEKLELFKSLERASEDFLKAHAATLKAYSKSWVADPFHQWSRRWEYPWVASRIPRNGPAKILDAGAGLTFFPFFLAEQNPQAEIHCVDSDAKIEKAYQTIGSERVKFTPGDLRALPFEDSTFDHLYCISVLEHTGEFEKIALEFNRVLRPGGRASITFDICLNEVAEISPRAAEDLVRIFGNHFRMEDPNAVQVSDLRRPAGIVRTEWIRRNKPESLPWRYPRLSALKAGLTHGKLPRYIDLTFCTLALVKE
jgi:SAM-dependent methyltransferase